MNMADLAEARQSDLNRLVERSRAGRVLRSSEAGARAVSWLSAALHYGRTTPTGAMLAESKSGLRGQMVLLSNDDVIATEVAAADCCGEYDSLAG